MIDRPTLKALVTALCVQSTKPNDPPVARVYQAELMTDRIMGTYDVERDAHHEAERAKLIAGLQGDRHHEPNATP